MTAFVSTRYPLPMETAACDKPAYHTPNMFRDFKLKRRRVQDIFGCEPESGALCIKINDTSDCDRRSDISSESVDSAYISDRSSDISDRRSIDEPPLKTSRILDDEGVKKFEQFTQQIKTSEPVANSKNVSMGMTYFGLPPAYLNMLQSHGVSQVPGLVPGGMRFIPVMGAMPGMVPSSLPNMPTPMFVAASSTGFMFSNGGSGVDRNLPIFSFPNNSVNTMTSHSPAAKMDNTYKMEHKISNTDKFSKEQDFIAHYTNGKFVYSGHLSEKDIRPTDRSSGQSQNRDYDSDGEEQMTCAICNDRATGLHYGIITCEGCKGFFKRTVQNKRVYTCVSDGDCEINKAQRNRCQYCRFKKCLQMGMVLAAVREDRMPGGRNSGAVYNLYKVKYKKHKRRDTGQMYKQKVAKIKVNCDGQVATEHVNGACKEQLNWARMGDRSQSLINNHNPTQMGKPPSPLLLRTVPTSGGPTGASVHGHNDVYDRRNDSQTLSPNHIQTFHPSHKYSPNPTPTISPIPAHSLSPNAQSLNQPHMLSPNRTHSVSPNRGLTVSDNESHMSTDEGVVHTPTEDRSFGESLQRNMSMLSPSSTSSSTSYQGLLNNSSDFDHLIDDLMNVDSLLGIAESYRIDQFAGSEDSVAETLCRIGDDIVVKLVQWIRQLPFYREILIDVQSQILTKKWHELLLLIMTAYGPLKRKPESEVPSYDDLYKRTMCRMLWYLNNTFGKSFSIEQLTDEIGEMMQKVTHIMSSFHQLNLTMQEYLCLQIILLLNHSEASPNGVIERVQDRYMTGLQNYVHSRFPYDGNRFGELLLQLPQIQSASALLLKSKMIYIPFLLNS